MAAVSFLLQPPPLFLLPSRKLFLSPQLKPSSNRLFRAYTSPKCFNVRASASRTPRYCSFSSRYPATALELFLDAVFDSGRSAAAEDGLFSDHEDGGGSPEKEVPPRRRELWSIHGATATSNSPANRADLGCEGEREPPSIETESDRRGRSRPSRSAAVDRAAAALAEKGKAATVLSRLVA